MSCGPRRAAADGKRQQGVTSVSPMSVPFTFTDAQRQFRDVVRRFLGEVSPPTAVRRLMATDSGFDPDVWERLAGELGLCAIHVPEACGGQGFSFVELGIALEDMGRALLCAPYYSSAVLATGAIQHCGSEAQRTALLPPLAAGARRGTLALTEPEGGWGLADVALTWTPEGGGHRLHGEKRFVLDGCTADLIIAVARTPGSKGADGLSAFTLAGNAEGLARRPLNALDPTRKLAHLTFRGVRAEPLGELGGAAIPLQRVLAEAAAALASEMVGGAQRMLESAVEYAKLRMQFGRPIGSFQAIKHKCADMLLEVELAKSAAYRAAAAVADGDPDAAALASLAKASASEAYLAAAANCIQIHGGIGFTWEHDTHLWFKRAKASEALLGDAAHHRELMMERLR